MASNNQVLLGIVDELSTRSRRDRPTVIGFDDVEWARVLGITVVAGDIEALGRRAARLATARLADRTRSAEHTVIPMRLITRAPSPW